jgi:uncharacterized repeat protein (TIGR03803 family)
MKKRQLERTWISRIRLAGASRVLALSTVLVLVVITFPAAQAQTLTTLHSFDGTDGTDATSVLIQATDGNFYGTMYGGGANSCIVGGRSIGCGTVFKITPSGKLTTLYNFCSQGGCTDGESPGGPLIQATNGDFYGTTVGGGANSAGTVFKITPSGKLTVLYSFCPPSSCSGSEPWASLIQSPNGDFYGTTFTGGATDYGTVFKITPNGTLTTLYSFCSQNDCADGLYPVAEVVQGSNGGLYGATPDGGTNGDYGTVFKIMPGGKLTTLHSFDGADGSQPQGALIQATDGNFYGTTFQGGANNGGTVFKMTPSGTLTTLYNFCSQSDCTDGEYPWKGLVQATDGNLYGTTIEGGVDSGGTVFRITPSGTLATLYRFCSESGCPDGGNPEAGLLLGTDGNLYGTTLSGGTNGDGTVFCLSLGLRPFVEMQTTSGKVGAAVKILGTDLTGATGVTFSGTAATFTVVSKSEITTTVPVGATSGTVEVVTSHGTLRSNAKFRVTP